MVGDKCFVRNGATVIEATVGGVEMLNMNVKPQPYWEGLLLQGVTISEVPVGAVVSSDSGPAG